MRPPHLSRPGPEWPSPPAQSLVSNQLLPTLTVRLGLNDGGNVATIAVAVYCGSAVTLLVARTLVINVGGHAKFTVAGGAIATRLPRPTRRVERRRCRTQARALA